MEKTSVLGPVIETLLCSPGMNEPVKIDIKVERKTVLLINSVIEGSLHPERATSELLKLVPKEDLQGLQAFADECLRKSGLEKVNEKMKSLTGK